MKNHDSFQEFKLATDASQNAIGACLSGPIGSEPPVDDASRTNPSNHVPLTIQNKRTVIENLPLQYHYRWQTTKD